MTGSDTIKTFFSPTRWLSAAGAFLLGWIALAGGPAVRAGRVEDLEKEEVATSASQIDCVTPDGATRVGLTMRDAKIRYALPRGVTSFIIPLAASRQNSCFTLVNENNAAAGRLSIAVADRRLSPGDPNWRTVEGAIPFHHKKLFALSLLGVEAKYVKLTFLVEDPGEITRHIATNEPANRFTVQPAGPLDRF